MVRCALHAGARAIYLTSQACENDISIIIPEYYSRLTPIVIFQKYLNFNDISRKCIRVCRPLWSLLLKVSLHFSSLHYTTMFQHYFRWLLLIYWHTLTSTDIHCLIYDALCDFSVFSGFRALWMPKSIGQNVRILAKCMKPYFLLSI